MGLRQLDENSIHWGGYPSVSNPYSSGLGLLDTSGSSNASTLSAPWSVKDPNSSFYENVFDCIFSVPGPALPSDAIRSVPRLVEQIMTVRGCQQEQSHADIIPVPEFETQIVQQVLRLFIHVL